MDKLTSLYALGVLLLFSTVTVGQDSDRPTIVFERGRWEIVSCTLAGKDCPKSQISDSTGPVSTAYAMEKKIDEIQCYRDQGLCVIASAGNANGYLYANLERFFVSVWDEHAIRANWVRSKAEAGKEKHEIEITFTSSGVDSVILDDSLTETPKGSFYKDHLIRYQLVHDNENRHF